MWEQQGIETLAGGDREEEAWWRAVTRKTSSQKWHLVGLQSLLSPAGNGVGESWGSSRKKQWSETLGQAKCGGKQVWRSHEPDLGGAEILRVEQGKQ